MSTFVEIRPIESPDTETTWIRLDGDFKLTVRTEKGGSHTDRQYNFSGLLEGQHVAETNDVASVRISKSGTDERAIVSVSTYHAAGDEGSIPPAGMYWYNWQTTDLKDAPDPAFQQETQVFTTIFNISTAGALPVGNSVASTVPARLYGQLGTTAARREYLKAKLLATIDSRDVAFWLAGNSAERSSAFARYLEMLARGISVDGNYDTELKFNLLDGEVGLNGELIARRIAPAVVQSGGALASTVRSNWQFARLGNVGANTPWTYSPPTGASWTASTDARITMSGVSGNLTDWRTWLRS